MKILKTTVTRAAIELNLDRQTLVKSLTLAGIPTGKPIRWRDIVRAVSSDPRSERGRESRARSALLELDLKERERELVKVDEVQTMLSAILLPIKQRFDSLPSECCAAVNPTDPKFAFAALSTWAEQAKRQITEQLPKAPAGDPEDEVDPVTGKLLK